MKFKSDHSGVFLFLSLSLLFIISGALMIINGAVAYGINSRTLMPTGFGGHYLILGGLIFLVVAYFSLPPFGKIRRFFEERMKRKR
ncbi:hypothetical protein [Pontibacter burrus]|uniref:Uncharacterized protein n=1 Tax=Pontibacter burrus TaxID=2704466 RepID=A0A6B3LTD5_9BACT|nr:hypothetical protein [Pontibacter burrus]NEM97516.1 hypothetical protein [Pontibacter burrus]